MPSLFNGQPSRSSNSFFLFLLLGGYDPIHEPRKVGRKSLQDMCFVMFVDRKTLDAERTQKSSIKGGRMGAWRLVVVENVPYKDMRLSGVVSAWNLILVAPNRVI